MGRRAMVGGWLRLEPGPSDKIVELIRHLVPVTPPLGQMFWLDGLRCRITDSIGRDRVPAETHSSQTLARLSDPSYLGSGL